MWHWLITEDRLFKLYPVELAAVLFGRSYLLGPLGHAGIFMNLWFLGGMWCLARMLREAWRCVA